MVSLALGLLVGILGFQQLSALPSPWIAPLAGVPFLLLRHASWSRYLAFAGLGFLLAWATAAWHLAVEFPDEFSGRDLSVQGVVQGLPEQDGDSARFLFRIDGTASSWQPERSLRARLRWRDPPFDLLPGMRLQLKIRLFPPRGFSNPGGFDYERWLYANSIRATGYVREDTANRVLRSDHEGLHPEPMAGMRFKLRELWKEAGQGSPGLSLVQALTIGDRSGFTSAHWEAFRATGTSHLVAISGLHVGLVAGLAFWIGSRVWRLWPRLCLRLAAPRAGAFLAMAAALVYALMAGMTVPTRRALVMVAVALAGVVLGRRTRADQLLAVAAAVVLILDPREVLSAGFWLSFAAVGAIFYVMFNAPRLSAWRSAVRVQLLLSVALVPVALGWSQPVSLMTPLVNLIAVPWFGLVLVPFTLLTTLLLVFAIPGADYPAEAVLWLADWTQRGLETLSALQLPLWQSGISSPWLLFLGLAGVVLAWSPLPWRSRWLGLPMLLPLVVTPPPAIAPGTLRFTLLDVGQGLSAVVQTARHVLVYDLGPRYSDSFNAAESVVLPFLRSQGLKRVDKLVISHDDIDHAGATARFLEGIPVDDFLAGQPDPFADLGARACHAGQAWEWDGVSFEVLHPAGRALRDNDASCVVRITHPRASLLLTGDITARVESQLARKMPEKLQADYVQAAHHGSRTSSSEAFVNLARADLVLFAAGRHNRYGFPVPDVVERWIDAGSRPLSTADTGAITLEVGPPEQPPRVGLHREEQRRYWHRP
ncbi:MAG: DNA internalization-related competence protein ComEC/Rec2 [Pseudomonadota bacterium]